jgi:hypothetical protein
MAVCAKAARAAEISAIREGRPDKKNCASQGAICGKVDQRVCTGDFGSMIIFGNCFHSPGVELGQIEPMAIDPALPNEVPVPGARGSIKLTL